MNEIDYVKCCKTCDNYYRGFAFTLYSCSIYPNEKVQELNVCDDWKAVDWERVEKESKGTWEWIINKEVKE